MSMNISTPLRDVILQMEVLNYRAKTLPKGEIKDKLYYLKAKMTEWLYRNGFMRLALPHHHETLCNGILHKNGPGSSCPRCNGTGVYGECDYVYYIFQVGDYRFGWMIPRSRAVKEIIVTSGTTHGMSFPVSCLDGGEDLETINCIINLSIWLNKQGVI